MSRYLILLPAPEEEWAGLPESEHEKGMRSHAQFQADLEAGDHTLVTVSPLDEGWVLCYHHWEAFSFTARVDEPTA